VEKSNNRLFHLAWKSRKERGISTFHTASTATGYSLLGGLYGSGLFRLKWLCFSPAPTQAVLAKLQAPPLGRIADMKTLQNVVLGLEELAGPTQPHAA